MSTDAYEKTLPPPPPSEALVGTVIADRYRIDGLLGEGGMGAVYVGEHLLMHKRVAVKVLHPEMIGNAEVVARFEREAMAGGHIDHPNVAAATDFGKLADGSFFLVLELLEGSSLRDVLDRDGAFPEARALHVLRQIASALTRAHALRIVHRDLKPENVMLVPRDGDPDFVKVLDFGIAKVPVHELSGSKIPTPQANGGLTQLGVMYGTPEYMAPEQALGAEIDARADLYALGIMLFEMLVGDRPFVDESRVAIVTMHVMTPPPLLRTRAPHVSPATEALVAQLLAKKPDERVQDARQLVDRINAILGGEAPSATYLPSIRQPVAAGIGGLPTAVAARAVVPQSSVRSEIARIQASLPLPLRNVPVVALAGAVAGVVLVGLLALVVVVTLVRRSGTDAPVASAPVGPDPSETASEAELREARTKGATALEELATRYPKDTKVLRALVLALGDQKRRVDAMKQMTVLVERDKTAVDDESLLKVVRASAEDDGADDLAFALMEGPLGARGTELLYDLATSQKAGSRAAKSLARPEIRDRSRAVAVALDLRAASSCDAKKALLPKAREAGDRRVLGALKSLRATTGCGFLRRNDCWSCLRQGTDLADAIKEIESRAETPAPASSER